MIREYVSIAYADPQAVAEEADRAETLEAFELPLPERLVVDTEGADFIALRSENFLGGRLTVAPGLSTFFNDPSGAWRYDLSLMGIYERDFGARRFLQAELRVPLYETISEVTNPSNSELPHVRSDIALYRRDSQFKLMRLAGLQFYHPAPRVYARASAGIYEEMFSGAGGQVLYLPRDGRWAVDIDAALGAPARLRGLVRPPGLPHRHRHRLAQLPHGEGRDRNLARRPLPGQGRRRAHGSEAPLRLRLGSRRLVHGDQRQRHHLARLAGESVPRQGHLHGDGSSRRCSRKTSQASHRLRDRAMDARRGADCELARRALQRVRDARCCACTRATASSASATATTTTTFPSSAPTRPWPDFVGQDVRRRERRRRARRLAGRPPCSAPGMVLGSAAFDRPALRQLPRSTRTPTGCEAR